MDFRIASAINKIRITSRQAINLNVNPNEGNFVQKNEKSVKVQIARAKSGLRKMFAQKPDEFVTVQTPEPAPKRVKQLAKLPKHKRTPKVAIPKKHKTPKTQKTLFEQDMQEISIPFISEEEQKWIDLALRNHNNSWNYKPLEEHYRPEIERGILDNFSKEQNAENAYEKAVETKTKAYFDAIKADEGYMDKMYWNEIIQPKGKKSVVVDLNNKLLSF